MDMKIVHLPSNLKKLGASLLSKIVHDVGRMMELL